jgi:hypothetical protein
MERYMRRLVSIVVAAGLVGGVPLAQSKRVTVTFSSQNGNHDFDAAADEYRQIWAAEGTRVIQAMEKISKLEFPEKNVKVEVYEGTSFSGRGDGPMRLRASYTADVKKGTLVHELGHRMIAQLKKRPMELDEHKLLFLYLYDLYVDLYGKEFADAQVAFGKTLKGLYDYESAWNWALAMTREERLEKFGDVLRLNRK